MTGNNHTTTITRNDYPVIVIIVGVVVLVASIFASSNDVALLIAPLSLVLIGIGVVLTAKSKDTGSRGKGLAKHQRFILFSVAMLLLAFFAYALIVIIIMSR